MRYSICKKKCHRHEYSSKEPAISLFLTVMEKYTKIKIKTCEEFCEYYSVFIDTGEMMFGNIWKMEWRKTINKKKIKVFKCLHCNGIFETRTSTEHIIKFIVESKILDKVGGEC